MARIRVSILPDAQPGFRHADPSTLLARYVESIGDSLSAN
jgi:hypothetical protein